MKRRALFTSLPALAAPLFAAPTLPSAVIHESKTNLTPETFGDLRIYFEGATEQAGMSPHPPLQHPEEEFMVITECEGEITVEGKPFRVRPV